jgi:hypothetical protein
MLQCFEEFGPFRFFGFIQNKRKSCAKMERFLMIQELEGRGPKPCVFESSQER